MAGDDVPELRVPRLVPRRLRVAVEQSDASGAVVLLRGELDRTAVPVLAERLQSVVDVVGPGRTVVVNLADTDFVDLGGMAFLVEATVWTSTRGSSLYLAGCSAWLVRLLRMTGLIDGLNVIPTGSP